jgi:hypothetical protein
MVSDSATSASPTATDVVPEPTPPLPAADAPPVAGGAGAGGGASGTTLGSGRGAATRRRMTGAGLDVRSAASATTAGPGPRLPAGAKTRRGAGVDTGDPWAGAGGTGGPGTQVLELAPGPDLRGDAASGPELTCRRPIAGGRRT